METNPLAYFLLPLQGACLTKSPYSSGKRMCCYTSGDGESSSFRNRESRRRPGRASATCVHGKAAASCHVARRGVASALRAVTGQQVKRGRGMLQGSAAVCPAHLIDLALHHGLHGGVLHHLAQHSAVAAADDEHLGWERREGGVRGSEGCGTPRRGVRGPTGPGEEARARGRLTLRGSGWLQSGRLAIISWYENSSRSVHWITPSRTRTLP